MWRLCYSVEEAIELDIFCSARRTSSRSDRYNLLCDQGFNFRWRYSSPEELSANMYGCGKVCLVNILSAFILNDYVRGNQFTEVVHGESGKYLLGDVLHLFALEQTQTNGIFQLTEGSFDAPAQMV